MLFVVMFFSLGHILDSCMTAESCMISIQKRKILGVRYGDVEIFHHTKVVIPPADWGVMFSPKNMVHQLQGGPPTIVINGVMGPRYMAENQWVCLGLFHPEKNGVMGPYLKRRSYKTVQTISRPNCRPRRMVLIWIGEFLYFTKTEKILPET